MSNELEELEQQETANADPEAIAAAVIPVAQATAPYNAQHALVERELVALLIEQNASTGQASALAHRVLQIESPLALFDGDQLNVERVKHALQAITSPPQEQRAASPPMTPGMDPKNAYGTGLSLEDFRSLPAERQLELRLRFANSRPQAKAPAKKPPPVMPDDIKSADAYTRLQWINANG